MGGIGLACSVGEGCDGRTCPPLAVGLGLGLPTGFFARFFVDLLGAGGFAWLGIFMPGMDIGIDWAKAAQSAVTGANALAAINNIFTSDS